MKPCICLGVCSAVYEQDYWDMYGWILIKTLRRWAIFSWNFWRIFVICEIARLFSYSL